MSALLSGDLRGGLPNVVKHKVCFYQDLSLEDRKFDVMVSHSVFEHIAALKEILDRLYENISQDGFIFTDVDYRDHRCFSQGMNPWQYLVDDGDHEPGYINKIRHSAMTKLIQSARWHIVECEPVKEHVPDFVSRNILQKYKSLSASDLSTLSAAFLLRRETRPNPR